MKTLLSVVVITLLFSTGYAQDKVVTDKGHISFFAKAPIADVDARNERVKMELNTKNGELAINMTMSDFQFKSQKMENDARTKYLETGKFTKASFNGRVEGDINYKKTGSYNVVAVGKINIHGVEKDLKEKGTVTVDDNGQVKVQSNFRLALKDFNIDTPEILGKKMTEEAVMVTVSATLAKSDSDTSSRK
jgi:polyisoprenoid-binding protein YceI